MDPKKLDEILAFAIEREQAAHDFYTALAERVERAGMKEVFQQFAREEIGHKAKLERIRAGKISLEAGGKVLDLKIADYLVEVNPEEELDYQKALVLAMKREKSSFRLYSDIAAGTDDPAVREIFLGLAQEEAKHKLRFEIEYDEAIMPEN